MKNIFKKDQTRAFLNDHSLPTKKAKEFDWHKVFGLKMGILYMILTMLSWTIFFDILPREIYDQNESMLAYFTDFWKGYNLLKSHDQILFGEGIFATTVFACLSLMCLFYQFVTDKDV